MPIVIPTKPETFTKPEWNTENERFWCAQNGLGSWWPKYAVKCHGPGSDNWCPIIIRNSNPFKTLNGAIKFTEATRERINKRKLEHETPN